ncbi:MAG: HAD-IIIC family phosphatase [Pseudomonadota bacterium]
MLSSSDPECGRELVELASHALNIDQQHKIFRKLTDLIQHGLELNPLLRSLKLGIISNSTTKLLNPCLYATGLRYGYDVRLTVGQYGQMVQEAINPDSAFQRSAADIVLLALDHRGIPGLMEHYSHDENESIISAMDHMHSIRDGLHGIQCKIIMQSVPTPPDNLFGNREEQILGSQRRRIKLFNQKLAEYAQAMGDLWLDLANLAEAIGTDSWFEDKLWHIAKLSFAQEIVPLYSDYVFRLIAMSQGRVRKCLVLDLDNTLWNGVIGDDGLEGIVLGQGSAIGEAHLSVQKMALSLRQRGIILAVCSKNNEPMARLPFQKHPDMLLREDHIAVFMANWRDKATNIEAIASALNIGLDSLVFLDDNPAERQQVRSALPTVAVPELPEDVALYPRTVFAGGYFEAYTFTTEDSARAELYQANARRALSAASYRNLDEYLASLEMTVTFSPFDSIGRSRICQLIARSNQFNLTTKRYSEADVECLESNPEILTLQVRVTDKFGDNGMISVIVCRPQAGATWLIDTWLMSCRVLGRGIENAVLDEIVENARKRGINSLIGHYIPTERNGMVRDHYNKLGFEAFGKSEEGDLWKLEVECHKRNPLAMNICRLGFGGHS